jgi:hypothetical protein
MSKRYECRNCKKSYNGHDKQVLKQLPLQLQAEFPAYLTHRSGVSKDLGSLLRICVQNSLGPKRFQKLLRELHMLKHDRLEYQYLNAVKHRIKKPKMLANGDIDRIKMPITPFSPFSCKDLYAGFVPTATYIRTLYNLMLDELRPMIDKQMMLIDGKILKGDHSFKIIKSIAKINGASTFTALYTLCNEYEEIRLQQLVPTKALSHLKGAFKDMLQAYELYGHDKPEYFFTDNVNGEYSLNPSYNPFLFITQLVAGDKSFLEQVIPSLRKNVSTANPDLSLPVLKIPAHIHVTCLDIHATIDRAMGSLMMNTNGNQRIEVGFDCEWSTVFAASGPSKVCLIQVAYGSDVYLLRTGRFEVLPLSLRILLESNLVTKVGRSVGADFVRLKKDFNVDCTGSLELATFCKDRDLVSSQYCSLDEICRKVLGQRLDKSERLSDWTTPTLSEKQIEYAALDAFCALTVYEKTKHLFPVGRRIHGIPPAGKDVAVFPISSGKAAAYGCVAFRPLSLEDDSSVHGNSKVALVRISKVDLPAYMVHGHSEPLSVYGPSPFYITVPVTQLRVWTHVPCTEAQSRDISERREPYMDQEFSSPHSAGKYCCFVFF